MGPEIFAWICAAGGLIKFVSENRDASGANRDQAVRRFAVISISTFISGL
jgi:hypothetical protein